MVIIYTERNLIYVEIADTFLPITTTFRNHGQEVLTSRLEYHTWLYAIAHTHTHTHVQTNNTHIISKILSATHTTFKNIFVWQIVLQFTKNTF